MYDVLNLRFIVLSRSVHSCDCVCQFNTVTGFEVTIADACFVCLACVAIIDCGLLHARR